MDSAPGPDPLAPFHSPGWLSEAQRKAIHLGAIILPLGLLYEWLPWPRGRIAWLLLLGVLTATAVTIDLVRISDHRVQRFFKTFFGELIREHERFNLLGSTFLLIAAILAVELFPQPLAAAAIGFTVLGDGVAALVGRGWGRTRLFSKSLEGALGGLAACLIWAAYLAATGHVPWGVGVVGALTAMLVEVLPLPLDDNLGITIAGATVMRLLWLPG
ncbi:MAG: diacylglycerol/polyprenol kinase family protein [Candidatus Eisenbacteria bacterium]